MHPCLNQDILFNIGKKLIEDGDQDAVNQFGLSGKEPLKALCKVFSTVTTLGLYDDHYAVGWDNKCCGFYFDKPNARVLIDFIGGSVTKLRLDYNKESSTKYYRILLNKITEKQQLTLISVSSWDGLQETRAFIQSFSSTLDHLEIDPNLMTTSLRDSLNLKCLTVLNTQEKCFSQNCPRASTIIFKNTDGSSALQEFRVNFSKLFYANHKPSPYLNTIKELIFIDENNAIVKHFGFFTLARCMKFLPFVEQITFKIKQTKKIFKGFFPYFCTEVAFLVFLILVTTNVPSKITYVAENQIGPYSFYRVPYLKELMKNFEFDGDTVPGFYCFRQIVQSAGTKSTIVEVQIPKGNKK